MKSSGAGNKDLRKLIPGAQVEHDGTPLGSVEEVVTNPKTGQAEAILVRQGRADYLLRVPASYVHPDSPSSAEIDADAEPDDTAPAAATSGRKPPAAEHITDADATEPAEKAEGLVGSTEGMPDSYDGPATG
jgi:sporulation protein YlmC with PRC-barrel domain